MSHTLARWCAASSYECRHGLSERTRSVGVDVSSDRARTSRSRASETRRPARHCSSISSFAFGLDAALMMAFTSSARGTQDALLALGGCAVLCFGITLAGPAPVGHCGGRVSSHTVLFSTVAQLCYMRCRQFVMSVAPGACRTCHSWAQPAPPSR